MKFILDILTRGHITNIVLKFPSYCIMNILSPLLIYPRSYSLSYYSLVHDNTYRDRQLCLQVKMHGVPENNINLYHSIDHEDNISTDTTQAVISHSLSSSQNSFNLLSTFPNTVMQTLEIPFQTNLSPVESTSFISSSNYNRRFTNLKIEVLLLKYTFFHRSTIEPYEQLIPYLNRSRNIQHNTIRRSTLMPIRQLSTSEQSVSIVQPQTSLTAESISLSDSNLVRQRTTMMDFPSLKKFTVREQNKENEINYKQILLTHLTPQNQTNSLTNLSIYYVSSLETIEMIAIVLLGK